MSIRKLQNEFGNIDIYLLDQILKGRYQTSDVILDAGCGSGRNLQWFYNNSFPVFGIDRNVERIEAVKNMYPDRATNFSVDDLTKLNFKNDTFDHVLCSAVLHFAESTAHFKAMFSELVRVLKPKGSLFIRMTSDIGIEKHIIPISDGVYSLPDGSQRFLLTRTLLEEIMVKYQLEYLEPLKTVNVDDKRCMTTLLLQKF